VKIAVAGQRAGQCWVGAGGGRTRDAFLLPRRSFRWLPVPSRRPGAARPRGRSWAALDATAGRRREAPPTGGRVV